MEEQMKQSEETILEVKDLSVFFSVHKKWLAAVDGVSFSVAPGEITGIVGESGSGKSVMSQSILRLRDHDTVVKYNGEILFEREDLLKKSLSDMQEIRGNQISIIFQDPLNSLSPVHTIGEQLSEILMLHKKMGKQEAGKRAVQMLELTGIPGAEACMKKYPFELSGGMQQRVMIAMALACEPKLLIADEPTTALDVTIQAQILELMMDLKEKLGMAIIMITHDLGVVANMCDRIAVMYAGKVVEYGTTDDIFYRPSHEYTKGLIRSIPKLTEKEHNKLVPIEGSPVDMLNPPAGCPFAPRCRACMKICLREMPPYTDLSDIHYSACWLMQKREFDKQQDSRTQKGDA